MFLGLLQAELLRITGFYKDCPASVVSEKEGNFFKELLEYKLIRYNKARTSLRLTKLGVEILSKAGFTLEQRAHPVGTGKIHIRRVQTAEIALFLNSLDVDVFLDEPLKEGIGFLSAVAIRRSERANLLGMSSFHGILYTPAVTYVVYNISTHDMMFYPNTEEQVFEREYISSNKPIKVIYMCSDSLEVLLETLLSNNHKKVTAVSYYPAINKFTSPVCLASLNQSGLLVMRIMLVENYKARIARQVLGPDYRPMPVDWAESLNKAEDEYFLVFFDFDVKRLKKALKLAGKLHIMVLAGQEKACEILLNGRSARVYSMSESNAFKILGLEPLDDKCDIPYLKDNNRGVNLFAP